MLEAIKFIFPPILVAAGGAGAESTGLYAVETEEGTFSDFFTGLEFIAAVCTFVVTIWV
jgi:hypothetical protein